MADPETELMYHRRAPALLVVDDFYRDPDRVRRLALEQDYAEDLRFYKGLRSKRWLFPYVKEEFERLLQLPIIDWMDQPANGVFQKTKASDPLVWHSDSQSYAAAIYLNPDHPFGAGTSFWAHFEFGCRRPSSDPEVNAELYSEHNLTHPDNWNLVDRIGNVYNRLVIWDAQLIHSASSYEVFQGDDSRLVQLFFFNVAAR